MTTKVERNDIVDYQTYNDQRGDIRARVMKIKEDRRIHVASYLTFLFENRETMRYQIQEMMRAEQIVKEEGILHELDTYNEVLGDEGELGCTLLIEIADAEVRPGLLKEWLGLPEHLYVLLEDGTRVRAGYDPRQVGDDRLSSVQYLKFKVGNGKPVAVGSDFPALSGETRLTESQRSALLADLRV
jgi:hypothetical protein